MHVKLELIVSQEMLNMTSQLTGYSEETIIRKIYAKYYELSRLLVNLKLSLKPDRVNEGREVFFRKHIKFMEGQIEAMRPALEFAQSTYYESSSRPITLAEVRRAITGHADYL